MIKAVLIDIDNTLLDFNESAKISMKNGFIKYNLPFSDTVFPVFKQTNDGLWLKIENKTMERAELHKVRWNIIFDKLNIDFDGQVFEKDFLDGLYNTAVPFPNAKEILEYLSKKYIVCTASNAFYNQQINRLNIAGLIKYIKYNFVSEKMGVSKPDVKFFEYCKNALSPIEKDEMFLIGDSISADIEGGKNFGIKTCLVDYENNKDKTVADYNVNSLIEIKNIL